jgi:ribosomal protein S14
MERQHHINQVRFELAWLETDSLYKCVRFIAGNRSCSLCGSARAFLDNSKLAVCRGNIFYWLEYDAPLGMAEWMYDTENLARALSAA